VFPQLELHARTLEQLAPRAGALGIAGRVAASLGLRRLGRCALLTQSRLPGASCETRGLPEAELRHRLEAALEPLAALQRAGRALPGGPDEERVFRSYPRLLERLPGRGEAVAPALRALQGWPGRRSLPAVLVHGDYWLGNLLFEGAPPRPSGILDWDRARAHGPAGLDALHLGVVSVARWRGEPMGSVLASVWEPRRRHAALAAHLARVERVLGLGREALEHLALALWLDRLWSAFEEGAPIAPRWLDEMLGPPAAAIGRWLGRAGGRA
jgi:hypothetical protein